MGQRIVACGPCRAAVHCARGPVCRARGAVPRVRKGWRGAEGGAELSRGWERREARGTGERDVLRKAGSQATRVGAVTWQPLVTNRRQLVGPGVSRAPRNTLALTARGSNGCSLMTCRRRSAAEHLRRWAGAVSRSK